MEIKADALFKKEIKKCIEYALQEFGVKTARKWQTQYKEIKRLLEFMPKRYPIVAHFRNETMEFRGAIIMENFKIIYFYNEEKDIIWLVNLWYMRQDPRKLNLRARMIERKSIIRTIKAKEIWRKRNIILLFSVGFLKKYLGEEW